MNPGLARRQNACFKNKSLREEHHTEGTEGTEVN
jgi:hypothetical protein